jgi:transposase-like protein
MPERPEPFETIARMRAEGVPEPEIAAAVGMERQPMWDAIKHFNARNPDKRIQRPKSRPATFRYITMAKEYLEGASFDEIARRYGVTRNTVTTSLHTARKHGLLPPAGAPARDATHSYTRANKKGAAPPLGHVGTVLALLDLEDLTPLLRRHRRDEPTLAHTIGRIVKEHLDDARRG